MTGRNPPIATISHPLLLAYGLVIWCLLVPAAFAVSSLSGSLTDPAGSVVPGATIRLLGSSDFTISETLTDNQGQFYFANLTTGKYRITAESPGFTPVWQTVDVSDQHSHTRIQFGEIVRQSETVTVSGNANELDVLSPDPAERTYERQELLDANPGRPGAPVSIPGYPTETASSGIKAPQYFAPGVAGDHGEPIAQFIAVGGYLLPNNLSANAHGNGYADPNLLVSQTIESVQIDGGAFNVREGNHSVNLAETYGLRSSLDPFLTLTGDYRDVDLTAGFSPSPKSWLAFEGSYGNGFLHRLEHRQQYKINGEHYFNWGLHRFTLLGIGYYGQSYIPGLVPIFAPVPVDAGFRNLGDSIDPRQKEQTHTALLAMNDIWQLSGRQQLQVSSFLRTYNLSLFSDFGQGLIRQSETRTADGGNAEYLNNFNHYLSLFGGLEYEREAPRHDDLDYYGFANPSHPRNYGPFTRIDANNVTLRSLAPYAAAAGTLTHYFSYYLGWRRDEISFENQDLLRRQNSFGKPLGVNSPKATVSFLPKDSWFVPIVSLSFGQAFFTADPRTGIGDAVGTLVALSHSYRLVADKKIRNTDIRLTLGHVTNSAELAKIDPDTGLQIGQGPSRLRFMTLALRHNFALGSFQASMSKADARDLDNGHPTPEAPRTILDFLGTTNKLPLRLQAKGEFEFVGRKPLGTGCNPLNRNDECVGTPVKEFRGALVRPFLGGRLDAGLNFLIARGYTGQTTQNFYPSIVQEVVGVRARSYVSVSFTYRFTPSR